MATDPAIRDHQAWLGYLQPDGLVVSPAALVDAQVLLNRNVAPLQQRFLELVDVGTEKAPKPPQLVSLPHLLTRFLEWPADLICGLDGSKPIPDSLKTPLREFGETLQPDMVLEEAQPADADKPWMILLKELPVGTDLDAPVESAQAGWSASHSRRFERLLRETSVPVGLISNGTHLRLVYAPRGENTGTLTFPVAAMTEVAGRPILSAFDMLLSKYRLLSAPSEACLPALLRKSREYQSRVSAALAGQVLDALYELLRGFQAANEHAHGELLKQVLAEHPDQVYSGLLTVLMRLVFLLYAEDRGLMPGSDLYVRNYAVHGLFGKLRADAEQYPDTMDHRYGAWAQLVALFRAVYQGCEHPLMKMPPRHGHLFDPDRFPFLEGCSAGDGRLPLVADGVAYRVLHKLLLLDGERLSYRTLDVEQIGSVYQTMMGFRLQVTAGQTIAIKPAKAHGAPVPLSLEEILAVTPADRAKFIADQTDYKLPAGMNECLKGAGTIDDLLAALERRIARNATPHPVPAGAMVLVPTDERRRTGSHYTPRALTEPIVRKALAPILKQLGEDPTPDQVLSLKVCDPAMGSGAFLVESCRQLGDELVKAWHTHGWKPVIPPDEDEILHARRIVAQRCLYGLDRNPMAVDLAKLSMWLATLAKDHPFTFLDHSLRSGDALVGLSRKQIAYFNLEGAGQRTFVQGRLDEQMQQALKARRQILSAGDEMPPATKAQKLAVSDEALDTIRQAGDLFVASFFDGTKPRERKDNRDLYLSLLEKFKRDTDVEAQQKIPAILTRLRDGKEPIHPFHWEIEFPEVFDGDKPGFDAIIGNPPFAGKNTLINSNPEGYLDWLQAIHEESHGNADLVAHFFRRAFNLIRQDGTFGLIATKTIGQGDTRSTGLRHICLHGGTIYSARKRFKWPGEAAVFISVVHVCKGTCNAPYILDDRQVPVITAYLFHAGTHDDPQALAANAGKSFIGCFLLGMGFTFDDSGNQGVASPISEMHTLIRKDPKNGEVIAPYIGGEEILNDPRQSHHRYVIDFSGKTEAQARERWPDLMAIVEARVKPERMQQNDRYGQETWWQFLRTRQEMRAIISAMPRTLVISQTGNALAFAFKDTKTIFGHTLVILPFSEYGAFACLQSSIHRYWAIMFAATMKDDLRYIPSDCFDTFPFPDRWQDNTALRASGETYYEFRAMSMATNNQGLTATYNRFHGPAEGDRGILKLRDLHDAMDRVVLEAYGWGDIQPVCGFGMDYLDVEDDKMPEDVPAELWWPTAADALSFAAKLPASRRRLPWRCRWPEAIRDEVLARLLELNKGRAAAERRTGLAAAADEKKQAKKRGSKKGQESQARLLDMPDTEGSHGE